MDLREEVAAFGITEGDLSKGTPRKLPTYLCDQLSDDALAELCRNALMRGNLWQPDVQVAQQPNGFVWFDAEDGAPERHGPFATAREAYIDAIETEGVDDPEAWGLQRVTARKVVEKRGPKVYRVEVSGGGDLDVSPQVAIFEVSEESAREIIRLAELVKANDLHKVERFDYRTEFLQFDPENSPEDAEEQGDENSVRTECDSLVVTDQDFFFSAYVKHTDVKVACEGQLISELAAHFGVPFSLTQAANVAPTSSPM